MPASRLISTQDLAAANLSDLEKPLIVFDGVCHLCTGFTQFVIRHDHAGQFIFLPAQSPRGETLYRRLGLKTVDWESNILVMDGTAYTEFDAFIEIARRFGGLWRATALLYVIPRPLRNWFYNRIARNRYAWFGKRDTCYMPMPELTARFLD
jgi:predicted DCC family thiol-disulfide oxidoreductase YuxK